MRLISTTGKRRGKRMNAVNKIGATFAICALVILSPAQAETIQFVATDLVDVNPGENLWQYDYTVSGHNFLQGEFFDIFFDPSLYSTLTAGPAPNADWDVAVLQQPNPANLPPFDTGIFDSFALINGASLTGVFSVSFIFLGSGVPGAQPFQIFDADLPPNLVNAGLTSPPAAVPEPSTAILFFTGLIGCAILHRKSGIRR